MPALVKSNVGSLAGNKGEERTREWPYRSKYCKKLSRISLPFMTKSSLSRVLEASEPDEKQERSTKYRKRTKQSVVIRMVSWIVILRLQLLREKQHAPCRLPDQTQSPDAASDRT